MGYGFFITLCVLMCLASSGVAQSVPLTATGGWITGDVVDAATSMPLGLALVQFFDSSGHYAGDVYSNPAGQFTMGQLNPGTYFAIANEGILYVSEIYDNVICAGSCDPLSGTPIPVNDGSGTTIHFALEQGGFISGSITDAATGTPLVGVAVDAIDDSGYWVSDTETDALGHYTIFGLPAGSYFVLADAYYEYIDKLYDNIDCPNGSCDPTTGDAVSVTLGQETSGIDFALDRGGSLSGTVTDAATGVPLENTEIRVYIAPGYFVGSGSSDFLGNYVVGGLPTGTYFAVSINDLNYIDELFDDIPCPGDCDPTTGTPVPVVVAAETPGINFALDRGGSFSGTITDSLTGAPLWAVQVSAVGANGTSAGYDVTDFLGRYVIGGLPTGAYFAETRDAPNHQDEIFDNIPCPGSAWCDPTVGDAISVTVANNTPGVDFGLRSLGTISGKITDATGTVPLGFVHVSARSQSPFFEAYTHTDVFGNYVISGLEVGVYHVRTSNGIGYIDEIYNNIPCPEVGPPCNPFGGDDVSVSLESDTSGIDFALNRGGTIIGRITDAQDGSPLSSYYTEIQAFDSSGNYVQSTNLLDNFGDYAFQGLPAGNYFAIASASGYVGELYSDLPCPNSNCDPTTGTPIPVALDSDTLGIDFALDRLLNVLFQDDFDDGIVDPNWTYAKGSWSEAAGQLSGGSSKKATALADPAFTGCSVCTVQATLQTSGGPGNRVWLIGWYQDKDNSVQLMMNDEADKWVLKQYAGGSVVAKKAFAIPIDPGVAYQARIEFDGAGFAVFVNNSPLFSMPSASPPSGTVGFQVKATNASFGDILVYE